MKVPFQPWNLLLVSCDLVFPSTLLFSPNFPSILHLQSHYIHSFCAVSHLFMSSIDLSLSHVLYPTRPQTLVFDSSIRLYPHISTFGSRVSRLNIRFSCTK